MQLTILNVSCWGSKQRLTVQVVLVLSRANFSNFVSNHSVYQANFNFVKVIIRTVPYIHGLKSVILVITFSMTRSYGNPSNNRARGSDPDLLNVRGPQCPIEGLIGLQWGFSYCYFSWMGWKQGREGCD